MSSILAVCDLKESKANLHILANELNIEKIIVFEELTVELSEKYKQLIFFLNPENIGNIFFLQRIKNILMTRKNKRSFYFFIDGQERLEKKALLKVQIELEKALMEFIEEPRVFIGSTKLMATSIEFKIGRITLEDIQKDRQITVVDEEGYSISGQALSEAHVSRFESLSGLVKFMDYLHSDVEKFAEVDIRKVTWGLFGAPQSGKTTFKQVVEKINPDIELIELKDLEESSHYILEGLVILLTENSLDNQELLRKVRKHSNNTPIKLMINRWDNYMHSGIGKHSLKREIEECCKQTLGQLPIAYISSYYAQRWLALQGGEVSLEEVMNDKEILFVDEYGFPRVSYRTNKEFQECFEQESYTEQIQAICTKLGR